GQRRTPSIFFFAPRSITTQRDACSAPAPFARSLWYPFRASTRGSPPPGTPIHSAAPQSAAVRSPIVHVAGSLQGDSPPALSQVLTFHHTSSAVLRPRPPYSTCEVASESTLPLSQTSPRAASRL